jgi:hypothetical protein
MQPRKKFYRIQTTDHKVARKLKKRKNAVQCMYGINAPIWIFELSYSSPSYAIVGLSNITGADVTETSDTGVFVSYTPKQLTITKDFSWDISDE